MARTKQVFTNKELPHVWAHKQQESGRTSNDSFYFRGDTIFSYRDSFPIACHVTSPAGEAGILFTTHDYSNTTSQHKSLVRQSIPYGVKVFYVDEVLISKYVGNGEYALDHTANCEYFRREAEELYNQAFKPRIRNTTMVEKLEAAKAVINRGREYAEFFGLGETFVLPVTDEEVDQIIQEAHNNDKNIKVRREDKVKADKEREANKQAELQKELQDKIESWKNGNPVVFTNLLNKVYLRIKGDRVETSKGANIPLAHAKQAIEFVIEAKRLGGWVSGIVPGGDKVNSLPAFVKIGNYQIDKVLKDGTVIAGCHTIEYQEILDLQKQLDNLQAVV